MLWRPDPYILNVNLVQPHNYQVFFSFCNNIRCTAFIGKQAFMISIECHTTHVTILPVKNAACKNTTYRNRSLID
jgi:hypothetical protein